MQWSFVRLAHCIILYLDLNKIPFFSNWQLHTFSFYTIDDEDLSEGPPPAGSDLGKCQR